MTVVSNTTPLHSLVLIDAVAVLPALFGTVTIPATVRDELSHPHAPDPVRVWIVGPTDWLRVVPAPATGDADVLRLDPGERDAIVLTEREKDSLLLIDERVGRATAQARGLRIAGTLGVIERAASRELLNGLVALDRLAPALLDRVAARLRAEGRAAS